MGGDDLMSQVGGPFIFRVAPQHLGSMGLFTPVSGIWAGRLQHRNLCGARFRALERDRGGQCATLQWDPQAARLPPRG